MRGFFTHGGKELEILEALQKKKRGAFDLEKKDERWFKKEGRHEADNPPAEEDKDLPSASIVGARWGRLWLHPRFRRELMCYRPMKIAKRTPFG